jgi:hypothetical protein
VWQIALAARVAKYGLTLHDAMWVWPVAAINQLIIYDELANGRKPRWSNSKDQSPALDDLLAAALTSGDGCGDQTKNLEGQEV